MQLYLLPKGKNSRYLKNGINDQHNVILRVSWPPGIKEQPGWVAWHP